MNIPVDPPRFSCNAPENSRAGGGDIHTNSIALEAHHDRISSVNFRAQKTKTLLALPQVSMSQSATL